MKVCTVFTGGTIGSLVDQSGYIATNKSAPFRLLRLYKEQYGEEVEFVEEEPYRILSENLSAKKLRSLVKCIYRVLQRNDIDGIVVTHGTDTLQYSAAVLGYLFSDAQIPIVLVSSNYIIGDERANGLTNFHYAIEFMKGGYGKGVFVSYCNVGGEPTIHRGTRLQPPTPYSDDVESVLGSCYGSFENGVFCVNNSYKTVKNNKPIMEWKTEVELDDNSRSILHLNPYVGMYYPSISPEVKVVLHESYHSGTIAVNTALKDFMKEAQEKNIPVFLTGLPAGQLTYETVGEYKELGIIPLQTSAAIAQYCKLWIAVSNGLNVSEVMNTCIAEDWLV